MSKVSKIVLLKFNGQKHDPPKLKVNLDLATFEGSDPLPWQPVTVEFLDQQKRVSTGENGLKMNVELEFLYLHEEIKAKLRAWIADTENEADKEIAEYDVLLPGAANRIEGAEQEINDLRQEKTKLDGELSIMEREVGQLKLEKEDRENVEEQAEKDSKLEYDLIKAQEELKKAEIYLEEKLLEKKEVSKGLESLSEQLMVSGIEMGLEELKHKIEELLKKKEKLEAVVGERAMKVGEARKQFEKAKQQAVNYVRLYNGTAVSSLFIRCGEVEFEGVKFDLDRDLKRYKGDLENLLRKYEKYKRKFFKSEEELAKKAEFISFKQVLYDGAKKRMSEIIDLERVQVATKEILIEEEKEFEKLSGTKIAVSRLSQEIEKYKKVLECKKRYQQVADSIIVKEAEVELAHKEHREAWIKVATLKKILKIED